VKVAINRIPNPWSSFRWVVRVDGRRGPLFVRFCDAVHYVALIRELEPTPAGR
jgi:hypothetical protein